MHNLFKFFTILCLSTVLVSCGGDEDQPVVTSESLQGEWELITMNVDMSTSTAVQGTAITADVAINSTEAAYTLSFDGSSWTTAGGYSYNYDLNVDQTQQSSEASISDIDGSGDFEIDGSLITISGAFFDFEFQGIDMSSISSAEQVAQVSFNGDGNLVLTQDEETEIDQTGVVVSTDMFSQSVWRRK